MTSESTPGEGLTGGAPESRLITELVSSIHNSITRLGAFYLFDHRVLLVTGARPFDAPEARERAEEFAAAHGLVVTVTPEMLIFRRRDPGTTA